MGIFSRFTDIINANVNSLLDKAEDPEKMVRLIIQEMEDTLVEVRTTFAKALADKKELVRKLAQIEKQVVEWQVKASLALKKNREDLARAALIEKQRVQEILNRLQDECAIVEENIEKLGHEVTELESKLTETRARQQALILRTETASKRLDARKNIDSYRTEEALAKFEQYERRVDELEAQADSYSYGKTKQLHNDFADLKAQDEIEQELERMKSQMNLTKNENK